MPAVVLVPVDSRLREAVLATAPRPEQEVFSGRAAQTLPVAEADSARHPYAMTLDGVVVGFFVLDTGTRAPDLLLRGFYVDAGAQGRGVGTAAVRELAALVARDFPAVGSLVLTVNVRNAAARAVYLAGGFVDGGELFLGGPAGPQHVLRLRVMT